MEQLRNVEGVSDIWMERFGTKMLGKIVSVCREYPWLQTAAPVTKEKEPSEMLIKVWMYVCGCGCMCGVCWVCGVGVWMYCMWCGCVGVCVGVLCVVWVYVWCVGISIILPMELALTSHKFLLYSNRLH